MSDEDEDDDDEDDELLYDDDDDAEDSSSRSGDGERSHIGAGGIVSRKMRLCSPKPPSVLIEPGARRSYGSLEPP